MTATYQKLPSLPTRRAWRLGVTSYVYPDDILPNVEMLAGRVDDIELVLFETCEVRNLPSPDTVRRLAELAAAHHFTYNVHFPIDRQLGSPDPQERLAAQRQMMAIFDHLRPIQTHAYVLHPEGIAADAGPSAIAAWQQAMADGVANLIAHGVPSRLLAVENLQNHPFARCEPFITGADLSVCVDIGHLWLSGEDVTAHIKHWLPRLQSVHLHGERDGHDHLSLAHTDRTRLAAALRALDTFTGVVTLEVFSFADTASSIEVLREMLA